MNVNFISPSRSGTSLGYDGNDEILEKIDDIVRWEYGNSETEEIYKYKMQSFKAMCNSLSYPRVENGVTYEYNTILGYVDADSKNGGTISEYMVNKYKTNFFEEVFIDHIDYGNIEKAIEEALEKAEKINDPYEYLVKSNDYPGNSEDYTDFDKQMAYTFYGIEDIKNTTKNFLKDIQKIKFSKELKSSIKNIRETYKEYLKPGGMLENVGNNIIESVEQLIMHKSKSESSFLFGLPLVEFPSKSSSKLSNQMVPE